MPSLTTHGPNPADIEAASSAEFDTTIPRRARIQCGVLDPEHSFRNVHRSAYLEVRMAHPEGSS